MFSMKKKKKIWTIIWKEQSYSKFEVTSDIVETRCSIKKMYRTTALTYV